MSDQAALWQRECRRKLFKDYRYGTGAPYLEAPAAVYDELAALAHSDRLGLDVAPDGAGGLLFRRIPLRRVP